MAARSAICSRVRRALDIAFPRSLYDAIHKNRGSDDCFGVELSRGDDLFHFYNREFRGSRHNRIKISRGFAIDQVTHVVCALRANESVVSAQRLLQNVTLSTDFALFFATSNFCAHADRREK